MTNPRPIRSNDVSLKGTFLKGEFPETMRAVICHEWRITS